MCTNPADHFHARNTYLLRMEASESTRCTLFRSSISAFSSVFMANLHDTIMNYCCMHVKDWCAHVCIDACMLDAGRKIGREKQE